MMVFHFLSTYRHGYQNNQLSLDTLDFGSMLLLHGLVTELNNIIK